MCLSGRADETLLGVRIEAGPVWQTINGVQIPSTGGTRIDLTQFGKGPSLHFRLDANLKLSDRSELRALYAPLAIELDGTLSQAASFQGVTLSPGVPTTARYMFNSYRLTYRYRFIEGDRFCLWAGLTAKVRDAEVRLAQGSVKASKENIGFVPLLHLVAQHQLTERFALRMEIDALAAPQGRAEDIALLGVFGIHEKSNLYLGYRTIEGGADGAEVYTFAWLHFFSIGLSYRL